MRLMGWVLAATGLASVQAQAADWPQYRGPNHDGSSPEQITASWPREGPREIWKAPLGGSFGPFAVSGGKGFCVISGAGSGAVEAEAGGADAKSERAARRGSV